MPKVLAKLSEIFRLFPEQFPFPQKPLVKILNILGFPIFSFLSKFWKLQILNIVENFRKIQSLGRNFRETFPEILTKVSVPQHYW